MGNNTIRPAHCNSLFRFNNNHIHNFLQIPEPQDIIRITDENKNEPKIRIANGTPPGSHHTSRNNVTEDQEEQVHSDSKISIDLDELYAKPKKQDKHKVEIHRDYEVETEEDRSRLTGDLDNLDFTDLDNPAFTGVDIGRDESPLSNYVPPPGHVTGNHVTGSRNKDKRRGIHQDLPHVHSNGYVPRDGHAPKEGHVPKGGYIPRKGSAGSLPKDEGVWTTAQNPFVRNYNFDLDSAALDDDDQVPIAGKPKKETYDPNVPKLSAHKLALQYGTPLRNSKYKMRPPVERGILRNSIRQAKDAARIERMDEEDFARWASANQLPVWARKTQEDGSMRYMLVAVLIFLFMAAVSVPILWVLSKYSIKTSQC